MVHRGLANAIRFLVDYTNYHFHDEEEVMRAINFTDFAAHRLQHREFVDKVISVLLGLKKVGDCNYFDLVGFLVQWSGNAVQAEP